MVGIGSSNAKKIMKKRRAALEAKKPKRGRKVVKNSESEGEQSDEGFKN